MRCGRRKNLAFWQESEMADSTVVRKDKIPGLSQTDCLTGKGSEGDRGPCATCQSARYVSNWMSAVQADANKICDWRSEVLAAEAIKAGRASERTCRIPRPPCFMGKLACNHCVSERLVLVMRLSADLKCPSNKSRPLRASTAKDVEPWGH